MKYTKGDRVAVASPRDRRDTGVHTVVFANDKFHPPVVLDNDQMYNYDELQPAPPARSRLQVEIDRIYKTCSTPISTAMPPPQRAPRPPDASEYEYVRCAECGAGYGAKIDLINSGDTGTTPTHCVYCGGPTVPTTERSLMKEEDADNDHGDDED